MHPFTRFLKHIKTHIQLKNQKARAMSVHIMKYSESYHPSGGVKTKIKSNRGLHPPLLCWAAVKNNKICREGNEGLKACCFASGNFS